jgi:hypothetical protein
VYVAAGDDLPILVAQMQMRGIVLTIVQVQRNREDLELFRDRESPSRLKGAVLFNILGHGGRQFSLFPWPAKPAKFNETVTLLSPRSNSVLIECSSE